MSKGFRLINFALLLVLMSAFTACSNLRLGGVSKGYKSHKFVSHKKQKTLNIHATLFYIERQWANTPYKLGGTSIKGADCSGFVQSAFREHFGTDIPRTTVTQIKGGTKVGRDELELGDIVFFRTGRGPNGLHNGIYTGNDEFIHLSSKDKGVRRVSITNAYWRSKFIGARRYLE